MRGEDELISLGASGDDSHGWAARHTTGLAFTYREYTDAT